MQVDVWACGCIFAELSTGQVLFPGVAQMDMMIKIFRQVGTPTGDVYPGVEKLFHWNARFPKFVAKSMKPLARGVPPFEDVLRAALRFPASRAMARDILNLRFFNMRLDTTEGAIQDFQIYQGERAAFAFQHMRLPNDLLAYLQEEWMFNVAGYSSGKNLARGKDRKNKHELQFYASLVAKGKDLNGEPVNTAHPHVCKRSGQRYLGRTRIC